jgi:anti-anti-sigma factor
MDMKTVHGEAGTVVTLQGKLNDEIIGKMRPHLERIPRECRRDVYVDLTGVIFIDAAAVGALVFLFKRLATHQQKLVLTGATGQPRRLLELLRIDRAVDIRTSLPASMIPDLAEPAA